MNQQPMCIYYRVNEDYRPHNAKPIRKRIVKGTYIPYTQTTMLKDLTCKQYCIRCNNVYIFEMNHFNDPNLHTGQICIQCRYNYICDYCMISENTKECRTCGVLRRLNEEDNLY